MTADHIAAPEWDVRRLSDVIVIRPPTLDWLVSILTLAADCDPAEWQNLRDIAQWLSSADTEDEADALIDHAERELRAIYPREVDVPVPAVYVRRAERAQFLAAVEGGR